MEGGKEAWVARKTPASNVVECYEQSKTVYPGSSLLIYGERAQDFKHIEADAKAVVTTSALQEVDRTQQQLIDHITELESANDAKRRRIDGIEERVNALVVRMEAVESP